MIQTVGIIKIFCPDRRGLVAAVTSFLAEHGANILDSNQHTDTQAGEFFMRLSFDLAGMSLNRSEIGLAFAPIAQKFEMHWQLRFSDQVQNVAILVSQQDHCLYDLLLRHRAGEFQANIKLIVSNHASLEPVARNFGIDWHYLPITSETKAAQEAHLESLLAQHQVDLTVLARYMQILSPALVQKYPGRIINIHHSLLPAFVGAKPYHQAYERSVKIIGATAHYVTEALDEGPIIAQDVAKVSHRDSVQDLVRRGRDLERLVLAQAVKAHLEDRVLVSGLRAIVFD
jgi:formyltetrahydrofolate deformylase